VEGERWQVGERWVLVGQGWWACDAGGGVRGEESGRRVDLG
jgi:hypothetical protein